jgi:DNA-binding MarR family transcriptional regulator
MAADPKPSELLNCAQSCAAFNIRRASRAVSRLYGQFMAETGLEPTQYSLLVASALAKETTVSRMAEGLAIERSALARNLSVMEKNGLLRIVPGDDRRTRVVAITEQGKQKLAEALPLWRKAQDAVEREFGAERLRGLLSELDALIKAAPGAFSSQVETADDSENATNQIAGASVLISSKPDAL